MKNENNLQKMKGNEKQLSAVVSNGTSVILMLSIVLYAVWNMVKAIPTISLKSA